MKQAIDFQQEQLTEKENYFLTTWLFQRYNTHAHILTIGDCLELLISLGYNFHHDDSDGRFFNNILQNDESVIAWDGEQLIDILWYELKRTLHKRLSLTP